MGVGVGAEMVSVAVEGFIGVIVGVGVGTWVGVGVGVGGIGGAGSGVGVGRHFFFGDLFLKRALLCLRKSCICLARLVGDVTGC